MKNFVQCAVIPIGLRNDDGIEWLVFSIFLTPIVTDLDVTAPVDGLFRDWPGITRLPGADQFAAKQYRLWSEVVASGLTLKVTGQKDIDSSEIYLDGTWWREHGRPNRTPSQWWKHFMRGIKMRAVGNPNVGASAAISKDQSNLVVPVHQSLDLADSLQSGHSTAEGLSSTQLNLEVVGPLILANALQVPFVPADQTRFEEAREALRRLDRAGSAGRSHPREAEDRLENEEEAANPQVKGRSELLEFISSLSDHPELLRYLGLLFDIRIPRSKFPEAKEDAKFFVSARMSWSAETDQSAIQELEHVRPTCCWLREASIHSPFDGQAPKPDLLLFTPAPSPGESAENSLLFSNGIFALAREKGQDLISTVQADLIAGLRAAVAEVDRTQNNGPRRRLALLNHGISAFLRDYNAEEKTYQGKSKEAMAAALNKLGQIWYDDRDRAKDSEHPLFAEDLVRGIVVEVSQKQPGRDWSVWRSLNSRTVEFNAKNPEKLPETFDPNNGVTDSWTVPLTEGPLTLEVSEARQPVGGWLLGPLGFELSLSADDLKALRFKRNPDIGEKYACYLLATLSGLMIILDGPTESSTQNSAFGRVLGDWIQTELQLHESFHFGQWVDLNGFVHRPPGSEPTDFFVVTERQVGRGNQVGLAGTLMLVKNDDSFSAGVQDKGSPFLRFELLRWQVAASSQEIPASAPAGQVFLEYETPEKAAAGLKDINDWIARLNPNGSTDIAKAGFFFSGLGTPAFVSTDEGDGNQLRFADEGSPRLKLSSFSESGSSVFEVAGLSSAVSASLVSLNLSNVPLDHRSVFGPPDVLQSGAIFRLELTADAAAKQVNVVKITEEVTPEDVLVTDISLADGKWSLWLDGKATTVDANTKVAISDPVPSPTTATPPTPSNGFSGGEETSSQDASGGVSPRTLGNWEQVGLRVSKGDHCRATLDWSSNPPRLSRLEIISRDPKLTRLGRLQPGEDKSEETSFMLRPIDSVGDDASINLLVDDETVIAAPPAAPGLAWRTIEQPAVDSLVKVLLGGVTYSSTGQLYYHADHIEVLSSLCGRAKVQNGFGEAHSLIQGALLDGYKLIQLLIALRDSLAKWLPNTPLPQVGLPDLKKPQAADVASAISSAIDRSLPSSSLPGLHKILRGLASALGAGNWSFRLDDTWVTTDQAVSVAMQELQISERPSLRLRQAAFKEDLQLSLPIDLIGGEDVKFLERGRCEVALIARSISSIPGTPPETREMIASISVELEASILSQNSRWYIVLEDGSRLEVTDNQKTLISTGRLLQVIVTWNGVGGLPTAVAAKARPLTVQGQIRSIDEGSRQLQLLVLRAPRGATGIHAGAVISLYIGKLWEVWLPVLGFIRDSGIPIEFTADTGLHVSATSNADWNLFQWPTTSASGATKLVDGNYINLLLAPSTPDVQVFYNKKLPTPKIRFVALSLGDSSVRTTPLLEAPNSPWQPFKFASVNNLQPLLADQFLVEDGIFTWFGDSVVAGGEGEASLPAAKPDPNEQVANYPLLSVKTMVPNYSLPELRVGFAYKFRLRAVFLSGAIPRGYCRNFSPKDAIFAFDAFGGFVDHAVPNFQRLDTIAPPRIGWPLSKLGKTECSPSSLRVGDVLEGAKLIVFDPKAGTPTEVHLYSDTRENSVSLHDLDHLKSVRPKLLLRPAEVTVRQAEKLGFCDSWLDVNSGRLEELYEKVIRPRDRIEIRVIEADPKKGTPRHHEITATPGLLLPRLPDADTDVPAFVLNGELLDSTNSSVRFRTDLWPRWRDLFLEMQPPQSNWSDAFREDQNRRLGGRSGAETDPMHLYVPRDADWVLEIHSKPSAGALKRVALYQLLLPLESKDSNAKNCLQKIRQGTHPGVSPPVVVRIRHFSNRPLLAPQLIGLIHVRPSPGESTAELRGVYELDCASSGTLSVQAAMEMEWQDTKESALPNLPRYAMQRLVYRENRDLPASTASKSARNFVSGPEARYLWGRSSDAVDQLETSEYTVTELPLTSPSVIDPKSESRVSVSWQHELGNKKHRIVFYRALAVSRFKQFFPEGKIQSNPLPGPFTLGEATTIERNAERDRVRDPWGWHRVEMPATARPEPPSIREAPPVYQWDPPWDESRGWRREASSWLFVSTRTCGCRLWLDRPWFSSGANEKLAVLCWFNTRIARRDGDRYLSVVSRWGKDPIHYDKLDSSLGLLTVDQVLSAEPDPVRDLPTLEPAPHNTSSQAGPTPGEDTELAQDLKVSVAVHTPLFHPQERAWFCDIFLRSSIYMPFAWLSVARYQPQSLQGLALSRPVRVENPVQIWPTRTLTLELSASNEQLVGRVHLEGERSNTIEHLLVCRVERLVEDEEFFNLKEPVDDAPEFGGPCPAVPVAESTNIWKPITFLTNGGAVVYELRVQARKHAVEAEFRLIRDPRWTKIPRLRLAFYETEEHFPAYELPERPRRASRPIYEEAIELPSDAVGFLYKTYSSAPKQT